MQSVFKTSIKDLVDRNKFFQCFICYDQFNDQQKFPMQVCTRQHFMCLQCVNNRGFKTIRNNRYACGLCSDPIKIKNIRKSPFLLNIKDFVNSLTLRQQKRKQNYKQCIEKQQNIITHLIKENQLKEKKINQLHQELLKLEQTTFKIQQQFQNKKKQNQKLLKQKQKGFSSKSIFRSSIFNPNPLNKPQRQNTLNKNELINNIGDISQIRKQDKNKNNEVNNKIYFGQSSQNYPSTLVSMFKQLWQMKQQLERDQQISKSQLKFKLEELQKHQKYLQTIAQVSYEEDFTYDFIDQDDNNLINQNQKYNSPKPAKKIKYQGKQQKIIKQQFNYYQSQQYPDLDL